MTREMQNSIKIKIIKELASAEDVKNCSEKTSIPKNSIYQILLGNQQKDSDLVIKSLKKIINKRINNEQKQLKILNSYK